MEASQTMKGPRTEQEGSKQPILLDVRGLSIVFGAADPVVRDVSFKVMPGETLALANQTIYSDS